MSAKSPVVTAAPICTAFVLLAGNVCIVSMFTLKVLKPEVALVVLSTFSFVLEGRRLQEDSHAAVSRTARLPAGVR
jgi:hypothetical protein